MRYRIIISSYMYLTADSPEEARQEVASMQESLRSGYRVAGEDEMALMLNAEVVAVAPEVDDFSNSTSGTGE